MISPRPWTYATLELGDTGEKVVCVVYSNMIVCSHLTLEDARFITRCANERDDLINMVEALFYSKMYKDDPALMTAATLILQKVKQ